jgi:hypothetical protein
LRQHKKFNNITVYTPGIMRLIFTLIVCITCAASYGQVSSAEELDYESDSSKTAYHPKHKNFVFIRSKRGNSGVGKTPRADSIMNMRIPEIVLVFSENERTDIEEREEANKERWDNLILTYPEFFATTGTYKNHLQYSFSGDTIGFKKAQGFYVYLDPPPKAERIVEKAAPVRTEEKKAPVEEKKAPVEEKKAVAQREEKKAVKEEPAPEPKQEEPEARPAKKSEPVQEEAESSGAEESVAITHKKKTGYAKPRRSKDNKACRPACYEDGDESLAAFFKDNISLSKKERKKAKKFVCTVNLQLNFDGTIKKAGVTGEFTELNKKVADAVSAMNPWNPMVKNGVTVKSQVKIILKYDREWKVIKPFEVVVNPRSLPKCKCVSDREIFGSE